MPDQDSRKPRRRRRGRPRPERPESAVQIIASARPPVDTSKSADDPLSPSEVAEMKIHFRFLRENRRTLDLKVNAAEDLLLNGAREPTHRGVCQHLLAKVERRRVELAVQRLDPAASARLLEGIIRFSPDIAYLLTYLESLKNAERPDAVAALAEALKRIDFALVSAAQMRRVLELIVELIGERSRPDLLFSLLQSSTFQEAFDKSAEKLPAPLADIMIPLRAAHAVVVRGAKNPFDAGALSRGVGMLLRVHEKVLRAQSPNVQKRLFDLGLELATEPVRPHLPGLRVLCEGFSKEERAFSEAGFRLASFCLRFGQEDEARSLLAMLKKEFPNFRLPGRLLEALDGERIGEIGLSERPAVGDERERFLNGMLLSRQLPVSVRVGTAADVERYRKSVEIVRSFAIPGVLPVVLAGTTERGLPYLATARLGRAANEILRAPTKRAEALAFTSEAVRILSALALAGVQLPDVRFRRFVIDETGRLWLRDLVDAERAPVDAVGPAHAALAREFCLDVLGRAERFVFSDTARAKLEAAPDCVAIARLVDELG